MINKTLIGMMMGLSLAGFANEVPVVMQSGIDGSVIEEREVETGTTMTTVLRVSHAQLASVDLQMNSTAKLAEMTLDVAPVGALSATTNGATMLVSDDEGRIWYYINDAIETIASTWVLQHKVRMT